MQSLKPIIFSPKGLNCSFVSVPITLWAKPHHACLSGYWLITFIHFPWQSDTVLFGWMIPKMNHGVLMGRLNACCLNTRGTTFYNLFIKLTLSIPLSSSLDRAVQALPYHSRENSTLRCQPWYFTTATTAIAVVSPTDCRNAFKNPIFHGNDCRALFSSLLTKKNYIHRCPSSEIGQKVPMSV